MAKDISIAISAKDQFSPTIKSMQNSLNAFDKEAEETAQKIQALEKKQDSLRGSQAKLQTSLDGISKALREAKKDYKGLDDAEGTAKIEKLHKQFLDTKDAIKQFSEEAKRAQREIMSLSDAQSRSENRAGGIFGGLFGKDSSMVGKLMGAGIGKLFGDAATNALEAGITSAFGVPTGNALAAVASGVLTGGVMGSVAGPGGIAAGAVVGGLSGVLNAKTMMSQAQDDAFKSVVQEQVQGQQTRQQEDLSAGSAIAAGRETSLQSFATLFGDQAVAENYLDEMKTMANTTPFLYDDLAQMSKVLKTYGYETDEMLPQLARIGDAGAALGLSTADMGMVAAGLGRMKSSGKTSLEYINLLQERGIDAVGYLAERKGVEKGEVYEKISKNLIDGAWAAQVISEAMGKDFAGSMEAQSKTFSGLSSTLLGMEQEMQSAMGEGYNEERKKGIQAQVEYLGGEDGARMEEANRLIGQYQASLENQREQLLRDAEREALEQIERDGLTGAEAGRVLAQARIAAQAEYNASEGAQSELESQKKLVEEVRNQLVQDKTYWNAGYEMGQEYTKGMAAAVHQNALTALEEADPDMFMPKEDGIQFIGPDGRPTNMLAQPAAAYGVPYVPRDDYLARLHEGERVLTAAEARAYREGGAAVTVTGNSFTVREEADIYKIARVLADEIGKARQVS